MATLNVILSLVLLSLVSGINGAPIFANGIEERDYDHHYYHHHHHHHHRGEGPQVPKRLYAVQTEKEPYNLMSSRDLDASLSSSDDSTDILGTISIVAEEAAPNSDAIAFGSLVLAFDPAGANDTSTRASYIFTVSNSTEPTEFMLHVESAVPSIPSEPDSKTVSLHIASLSAPQPSSLPSLGVAGMIFCAQFEQAKTSVSPMSVVPCSSAPSRTTSQRFLYNSVTGFLNPLWATINNGDQSAQKRDALATGAKLVFSPLKGQRAPDVTALDDGGDDDTVGGDDDSEGTLDDDDNDDPEDSATDDDNDVSSVGSPPDPSIETASTDDLPVKVVPTPVQGGDKQVWATEDDPPADSPPPSPPVDDSGTCAAVDLSAPEFYRQNGLDALAQMDKYGALTSSSPCDETVDTVACIGTQFAQCNFGAWVLTTCGPGTTCRVLPLYNAPGTSITCDTEADGIARLQETGALPCP